MSCPASHHHHQPKCARPNPYQVTTLSRPKQRHITYPHYHSSKRKPSKDHVQPPLPRTTIDIGYSDGTATDCYDYCDQNGTYKHNRHTDITLSDDSGSTRLPYFEFDEESNRGCSRNSFSEPSLRHSCRYHPERVGRHKDYHDEEDEEEEEWEERLYHEIQTPCDNMPVTANNGRREASRLSDRAQSSMSSALTGTMVYGCGGKCQIVENICYFVLQLLFSTGILIGISLCIAGLVLRKSAARNLQVLVYIGLMLAIVSGVLLTIQCRAKNTARRRIKAIQTAKRAPIPMEPLTIRTNPVPNLERMASVREQRINNAPQVHRPIVRIPSQRPPRVPEPRIDLQEQQGIPWWRRRDLRP